MIIKYKDITGELTSGTKGYYSITQDGDIMFREFIFWAQNDKGEVFAYPVFSYGENNGELNISDGCDLYNSLNYHQFEAYLQFEIKECYGELRAIEARINNTINEANFRGVYISLYVRDYIKNKEYLTLINNYNEQENRN